METLFITLSTVDLHYHKPDEIQLPCSHPVYFRTVPSYRLRLVFEDVTSLQVFQQNMCTYGAKTCTLREVDQKSLGAEWRISAGRIV